MRKTIEALERRVSESNTEAFEACGQALAEILGRCDAMRWPARAGQQSRDATIGLVQLQRNFAGVPLSAGRGSDSAAWQRSKRLRDRLAAAGLVAIQEHGGRAMVKVSPAVERRLRAAVGVWVPPVLSEFLESLIRSRSWIAEDQAVGGQDGFELVAPMVLEGSIEARSDTVGRLRFRWLREFRHEEISESYRPEWAAVYTESFCNEFPKRQRVAPVDSAEVFLPMPASFQESKSD